MEKTYFVQRKTMSGIADEVRELSGKGTMLNPEQMTTELDSANTAVDDQADVINEIREILANKRIPEEGLEGTDEYVDFYDYDGTLLHRFTVLEIQEMTELPPLPKHEGLICQGWNWTLEQLKDENGPMIVAPYYKTSDDKTKLVIEIPRNNYHVAISLYGNVKNVTGFVDWGDMTDVSSAEFSNKSYTFVHTYKKGKYDVKIWFQSYALYECYIGHSWSAGSPVLPRKNNRKILKEFYPAGNGVRTYMALDGCATELIKETYAKNDRRIIDNSSAIVKMGEAYYSYEPASNVKPIISIGPYTSLGGGNINNVLFNGYNITLPRTLRSVVGTNTLHCIKSKYFRPYSWSDNLFGANLTGSEIEYIILPEGITEIAVSAFKNVITRHVELPDSITKIGEECFYESPLEYLKFPDNLETIPKYCCYNCTNLTEVRLPSKLKCIEYGAFYGCPIAEITLPNNLESIKSYAFRYTDIEEIYIPDSVIECGSNAFEYCTKLRKIRMSNNVSSFYVSGVDEMNIPTSWTSIPNVSYIFDIVHMEEFTFIPTLTNTNNIYAYAQIYVPSALYDEWIKATNWSAIASRIVPV